MNPSNGAFEWWQVITFVVFIGASWLYVSLTVLDFIHRSSVCLLSRLMQACQFSLFWAVEKWCFLRGFGWRSSPLELVAAQTRDGAWVESGCFRGSCGLETQHSSGVSSCVWPVRSFSALSMSNYSVIQMCPCRLCSLYLSLCRLILLGGVYKASICLKHCLGSDFNWIHDGWPIHHFSPFIKNELFHMHDYNQPFYKWEMFTLCAFI